MAPGHEEDGKLEGIKAMAAWTGLSMGWWYAAVAAKRVPHYKVGKYVKFRRAEIEAWLATQQLAPQSGPGPSVAKPERRRLMEPERPHLRELLPDEIWERFLTAIGNLEACERRIDELTMQVEALTQALREARRAP
jgi:excisionase family DNA binding protein